MEGSILLTEAAPRYEADPRLLQQPHTVKHIRLLAVVLTAKRHSSVIEVKREGFYTNSTAFAIMYDSHSAPFFNKTCFDSGQDGGQTSPKLFLLKDLYRSAVVSGQRDSEQHRRD